MKVDQNKLSLALIVLGTAMLIAAGVLFAIAAPSLFGKQTGNSSLQTIAAFGDPITPPTPGPTPTPSGQFPPGDSAPVTRLIIDKAKIDAPVVTKGVDANGVMQSPDNAYDTVWYDFSAHPGFPGNAVFAGHVDYIHVGEAVFWNLKDLNPGDLVQVRLADGTIYKYAVVSRRQYDSASAPVNDIVGPTPNETVTLITCSGTFNSATHQYDKRLVVRAERIADTPGATPPAQPQPGARSAP
ncbi:MAG TPA: class F sortase [Dehalococcoidia bacterium]|nr:class F sortase [Dehalococcoidia bacterium]